MFCLVHSNSDMIFGQSLEGHRTSGFETRQGVRKFQKPEENIHYCNTSIPLCTWYRGTLHMREQEGFSVPTLRLLFLKQNTV